MQTHQPMHTTYDGGRKFEVCHDGLVSICIIVGLLLAIIQQEENQNDLETNQTLLAEMPDGDCWT